MFVAYATNIITRLNHAYQEASTNVSAQKTFNVVYDF